MNAASRQEYPNAIPIERRIQIRQWLAECRENETANLCLPLNEVEVLLRCYEHGRFQT